jgi:ADP-ribose pyrophosphatase YjhB (NUDIX family)
VNDQNIIERPVDSQRVFDGILLHIDHMTYELPNGHLAKRECARHIGASAVIPVDDQGNVWLVKQFRACIDQVLLEIPAGKLDFKGEDRLEAARRELQEETGLTGLLLRLVGIYSAPGRDPRGWTVSAAYAVCVEAGQLRLVAGDDAAEAEWFDVRDGAVILPEGERLAFDHSQIIRDAANSINLL